MKNSDLKRLIGDSVIEPRDYVKLNDAKLIPSELLPSYVDDVIEGYLHNSDFWKTRTGSGTTQDPYVYTDKITPESGKIYVDKATSYTYRWSGTLFVQIGNAEIEDIKARIDALEDEIVTTYTDSATIDFVRNTTNNELTANVVSGSATSGQVLTADGNGGVSWQTGGGGGSLPTGSAGTALVHNGTAWIAQSDYGYVTPGSGFVVTWDGDTTGKDIINIFALMYYKVSTAVPTSAELSGQTFVWHDTNSGTETSGTVDTVLNIEEAFGGTATVTSGDATKLLFGLDSNLSVFTVVSSLAQTIVLNMQGQEIPIVVPSTGLFFPKNDAGESTDGYISSFGNGTPDTVHTIAAKFIPSLAPSKINSSSATAGQVLTANSNGTASWETRTPLVMSSGTPTEFNCEYHAGTVTPNLTLPAPNYSKSQEFIYHFTAASANASFTADSSWVVCNENGSAGLYAGNTLSYTNLTAGSIYECSFKPISSMIIRLVMTETPTA